MQELYLLILSFFMTGILGLVGWTARQLYQVTQEISKWKEKSKSNRRRISQIEEVMQDAVRN